MDHEARRFFAEEWETIREYIIPKYLRRAANQYYDHARELGVDGWDGTTQLEKDGGINQHLND